jgi:hypothetical protein
VDLGPAQRSQEGKGGAFLWAASDRIKAPATTGMDA